MAEVYQGMDTTLDGDVALKLLRVPFASARVIVKTMAVLSHPDEDELAAPDNGWRFFTDQKGRLPCES